MGPDAASSTPADSGAIVSIIVPTLNEAENLPLLVPRIAAAMTDQPYEVIIVDDGSADETAAVCARLAEHHPLTLHVRDRPTDGLSGAVLSGFGIAKGDVLVVMDADLQHPPESLPALIEPLRRDPTDGGADFVVGSRHAPGGGVEAGWSVTRRVCSRAATLLARPFAGRGNTDPMSGFFALRRSTLDRAQRLTPLGFKVGLELMCKCRAGAVKEVPIHFRARTRGRSKLTLGQQFKYLEHLSRLYDFTFPRGSPVVKFIIATGVAWFTGFAAFLALTRFGVIPMPAATLSYAAAIVATGVFHLRYARTQRQFLATRAPWRDFLITCLGEWTACAVTATWIANRAREIYPLEVFLITYSVATLARYVLRKELLQDLRGLRKDLRSAELT